MKVNNFIKVMTARENNLIIQGAAGITPLLRKLRKTKPNKIGHSNLYYLTTQIISFKNKQC